jgi:hypothetical protein
MRPTPTSTTFCNSLTTRSSVAQTIRETIGLASVEARVLSSHNADPSSGAHSVRPYRRGRECPFAVPEPPIGGIFECIECERVRMVALGAVEAVQTDDDSGEAFLTVTFNARREFG